VGTRCANHVTPLYLQKLALTSPTGGGRSVGMVRSRTKATELLVVVPYPYGLCNPVRIYRRKINVICYTIQIMGSFT